MVQSFALALRGSMLSVHTGDNPWPSLSCLHPHQSGSARWNWKGCWRLQRFCANAPVVSIWALSRNIVKLKARTIRYTKPSFACKLPVIVLKINLVKVSCTLHLELKWFECSCVGPRFCISHHSHHIKGDANVGWTNCSCEASIRLRRVLRLKLKPIWAIRKTKHCKAVRNTQTKLTKLTKQATELKTNHQVYSYDSYDNGALTNPEASVFIWRQGEHDIGAALFVTAYKLQRCLWDPVGSWEYEGAAAITWAESYDLVAKKLLSQYHADHADRDFNSFWEPWNGKLALWQQDLPSAPGQNPNTLSTFTTSMIVCVCIAYIHR